MIRKYYLPPNFGSGLSERELKIEVNMISLSDEELERNPILYYESPLITDLENNLITVFIEVLSSESDLPCQCISGEFLDTDFGKTV